MAKHSRLNTCFFLGGEGGDGWGWRHLNGSANVIRSKLAWSGNRRGNRSYWIRSENRNRIKLEIYNFQIWFCYSSQQSSSFPLGVDTDQCAP